MKRPLLIFFIISLAIAEFFYRSNMNQNPKTNTHKINYFVIGDSYSNGEGATLEESWPAVLTNHLQKDGIDIDLIANPSVTGWTSQQAIENELPLFESSQANFATLLIGVNDWVQGIDKQTFHRNLIILLDRMQQKLPDKNLLLLVTIPDFGVTPVGARFSNGRNISQGIDEFNQIIKEEASKRSLTLVDIYPVSQQMKNDPSLISPDGLHPSAKEYKIWEELIYPATYEMLKNK